MVAIVGVAEDRSDDAEVGSALIIKLAAVCRAAWSRTVGRPAATKIAQPQALRSFAGSVGVPRRS